MRPGTGGLPNPADIVTFANGYGVTALQAGPGGDIFAVDFDNGRIIRYIYSDTNNPPTAVIKTEPSSGLAPLTVSFDGTDSNDADGDSLTYAWDLDGDGQFDDSTMPTAHYTFTTNGTFNVSLRVTDSKGASDTAVAQINVGNTAPTATISRPTSDTTWKVGDTIAFSGTAVDSQDGTLPGSALVWTLVMHHCPSNCHAHQITTNAGASGTFTAPDHEYPSYLELRLTVEDSGGLTDTTSVSLYPKTVDLTFAAQPHGFRLTYLAETATSPFTRTAIVGASGSISADRVQTFGGRTYRFSHWSDGGPRTHNVIAPGSATTYTATYRAERDPRRWQITVPKSRPVTVSTSQGSGSGSFGAIDDSVFTQWFGTSSYLPWHVGVFGEPG
jgi:PKD repeat protein